MRVERTSLEPREPRTIVPREAAALQAAQAPKAADLRVADSFQILGLASSASGDAAAGRPRATLQHEINVPIEDQGATNGCGTTSLAAVLSYWGVPRTREQIDRDIRVFDIFTAPDDVVSYAQQNGMRASLKNDASLEDIAKMIDQGAPPMVLMDPDGGGNLNLHYMVATGYERDANGKITNVSFSDPAIGGVRTMDADSFMKSWSDIKMGGIGTGLDRVLISMVPNDGRTITGNDGIARKASQIELPSTSFWSQLKSLPARGIASLVTGATNLAGKVWNGIKTVGNWIGDKAAQVGNWIAEGATTVANAVADVASGVWNTIKKY